MKTSNAITVAVLSEIGKQQSPRLEAEAKREAAVRAVAAAGAELAALRDGACAEGEAGADLEVDMTGESALPRVVH